MNLEKKRMSRLERREQQRRANAGRALKMHEARVTSDTPEACHREDLPLYNVGCSGWFYWGWKGGFYPATLPTKDWFKYYCRHFSTVELNAPFYSWPTVNAVQLWTRQAASKEFVYTVKVCELITHIKRFVRTKTLVRDFQYIATLVGKHMGCFLFQLPPSYSYTPSRLRTIVSQLENGCRNVVEFRHSSWWNKSVYRAFEKSGIIFCSCSAPKLPQELIVTAPELYIRFHGLTKWYRHDYTKAELEDWVEKIKASGSQRAWIYFNNDFECNAVRNAKQFRKMLN